MQPGELSRQMTCRIDRLATDNDSVILRISGRMTAGALDLLRGALAEGNRIGTFDLKDLRQVDREAVKLLTLSEASGIELRNCPAYIREWVDRERAQTRPDQSEA